MGLVAEILGAQEKGLMVVLVGRVVVLLGLGVLAPLFQVLADWATACVEAMAVRRQKKQGVKRLTA